MWSVWKARLLSQNPDKILMRYNKGPVDKSKISAEARSGPGRTVNLETEKDGIYHSFKV